MSEQQQVGVLLIATRKYKQYVPALIEGIKKNFLLDHKVTVFLFSDECGVYDGNNRVTTIRHLIPSYKFPEATMYRYRIFREHQKELFEMDYLYYFDVDMKFADVIGEEIFESLVAVQHCGFYKGGGSWEDRKESECYVLPEDRKRYYAGGFQGGAMRMYIAAMLIMDDMIKTDEENGIIPIWHDESAWNKYLSVLTNFTELPPSYCLVEQIPLRKQWGVDHFKPKIIALAKNHKEIRS